MNFGPNAPSDNLAIQRSFMLIRLDLFLNQEKIPSYLKFTFYQIKEISFFIGPRSLS